MTAPCRLLYLKTNHSIRLVSSLLLLLLFLFSCWNFDKQSFLWACCFTRCDIGMFAREVRVINIQSAGSVLLHPDQTDILMRCSHYRIKRIVSILRWDCYNLLKFDNSLPKFLCWGNKNNHIYGLHIILFEGYFINFAYLNYLFTTWKLSNMKHRLYILC